MYCRSKYIKVGINYLAQRTFKVSSGVGMVFIKGRKEDILRVLKPAFKEQIWILRLIAQISALSLLYVLHKNAQNKETRV